MSTKISNEKFPGGKGEKPALLKSMSKEVANDEEPALSKDLSKETTETAKSFLGQVGSPTIPRPESYRIPKKKKETEGRKIIFQLKVLYLHLFQILKMILKMKLIKMLIFQNQNQSQIPLK